MTVLAKALSSAATEVLMQLFVDGPKWDGNVVSKSGCAELVEAELAEKWEGWTFLTRKGVIVAVEWDTEGLKRWKDQRWYRKAKLNQ